MRNLAGAIRGTAALRVTPEDGLTSLAVALAATRNPSGGLLPAWQVD